jgi:hypothetical protein
MFKVSQFDPKTLRWWISQRAKIDMDPPYQRHGRLWSPTDKAFLAAKLLLFEFHDELRETKKRNLDEFVKEMGKKKQSDRLEVAGRRVVDVLDEMAEIFLPKDVLRGSAGVFPIYYWFVRNTDEKHYDRIRKFLVEFENARRENRPDRQRPQ